VHSWICAFSGRKIPKKSGFEPRNSCLFGDTGDQLHQWDIQRCHPVYDIPPEMVCVPTKTK
jgi:hypothetical protein